MHPDGFAWSWPNAQRTLRVLSTSFHPDGRQLVSAGYDKVVRLYDVGRGGAPLRSFEGHHALVSRAVFSPHGKLLITGSKDTTIRNGPTLVTLVLTRVLGPSPPVRPLLTVLTGLWVVLCQASGTSRLASASKL